MRQPRNQIRPNRTRPRAALSYALALGAISLVVLHVALLVERLARQDAFDPVAIFRWIMAAALLALWKRAGFGRGAVYSPAVGIAIILIFVVIHAPMGAPDPQLALAATGLGLGLSLVAMDVRCAAPAGSCLTSSLVRTDHFPTGSAGVRDTLKDRGPPRPF